MKLTRAELAANPNLTRLLSPESARELGISPPQKSSASTKPTLADAWASLTPEARRRLRGAEAKEHGIFSSWLTKHAIPFIHAPTSRKVVDLPPGWPDFSIFKKSTSSPGITLCLLIEFKVPGGVFSWQQQAYHKLLDVLVVPNAFQAIASTAAFCEIHLPSLNQTKPLDL